MPERFGLEYTDQDGAKKRPVMIHRALLGSMERFIGILIEHYGGALPLWLSPVQLRVVPVSDKSAEYARRVLAEAEKAGLRAELDGRPDKVGYKIRDAEVHKVPYMAVVGERERDSGTVSLRRQGEGDLGTSTIDEMLSRLTAQVRDKT
jgi:threonyl-tRNA synthetase